MKKMIKFSKNLYTKKAIRNAIKDYNGLADFNVSETKNYIKVDIKNIDKGVENIIQDEFCNYVLYHMKK